MAIISITNVVISVKGDDIMKIGISLATLSLLFSGVVSGTSTDNYGEESKIAETGISKEYFEDMVQRDKELMQRVEDELKLDLQNRNGGIDLKTVKASQGEVGEIWVSTSGQSSGVAFVGHAAIISTSTLYTIEAYAKDFSPRKVGGVQYYYNDWASRDINRIRLGNRVSSLSKRKGAAEWAEAQVGKPYFIDPTNKYRTDKFYCSQLVWNAWRSQGNDIDYIRWDQAVTPAELVKSDATIALWSDLSR